MDYDRVLQELYGSNFSVFLGNFGRGKSISLTYLSIMSALLNKRKVIMSNMPIYDLSSYGIEFMPLISSSQFSENMCNVQIVIDELQKVANSRKSLSPENSFVTEFSTDVRKFNQGVTATAQFNNTYDIRLCDNTEVNVVPNWKITQKKDRTDFRIDWNIVYLDSNEDITIELNLDVIKDFYNTNFKPSKIIINHKDYIENLTEKHNEAFMDKYFSKTDTQIKKIEKVFKDELEGRW